MALRTCDHCEREHLARGMCKRHYQRWTRYGRIEPIADRYRVTSTRHGDAGSIDRPALRLYRIWRGMKQRCLVPTEPGYRHYGGRGIKVCKAWLADYVTFRAWALANGYRDDLQIDRVNPNGHYTARNCRWVTAKVNSNNRRTSRAVIARAGLKKPWKNVDAHVTRADEGEGDE